jgi:hypothetical protein
MKSCLKYIIPNISCSLVFSYQPENTKILKQYNHRINEIRMVNDKILHREHKGVQ